MRIVILSLALLLSGGLKKAWGEDPARPEDNGTEVSSQAARSEDLEEVYRLIEELRKETEDLRAKYEAASGAPDEPSPDGKDVRFYWKNGLNFESYDKKTFKGKLGGRLQFDWNFFDQDDESRDAAGDADPGLELRRARLYTSGEMNIGVPTVYYKLQLDFAGSDYKFADAFLGMKQLPYIGLIQIGQMYEPFSLEQNTSSNYITFLERSLPIEAFSPARNVGAMLQNGFFDESMTVSVGVFVNDENDKADIDSFDGNTRVPARITGLPWYDESSEGRRYLHLGVSGDIINPQDGMVRFRSRPEAHQAPRYVDTGDFAADWSYPIAAEVALTLGSLSLQGEYMHAWVDASSGSDPDFHGFYAFASYFLTGEHRPYHKASGVIDRVIPLENFSISEGGTGAWELAARISYLDLDDEGISGGRLWDWTAGVNWYFNPNSRVMINYVLADVDRDGEDGETHIFQGRFQVDF